jgi:hypothetical protein
MPAEPKTIYLEADEEITSVVDKLRKTEFPKVILVVPKEASLLQSIVNLKLLKRQAENLKKQIAIVTTDKVGRNLAEKVGIMAAARIDESLKSADDFDLPEEAAPTQPVVADEDETNPLAETNEVVYKKPKKEATVATADEEDNAIVIKEGDDEEAAEAEEEKAWSKKEVESHEQGNLMPKFPKLKAFAVGGTLLLVVLTLGFIFLPRAKATVMVQAEKKQLSLNFQGTKDATLDKDKAVIPTQIIETTKETSQKFQATGTKNVGTKASADLVVLNGSGSTVVLATFSPVGHSDLVFSGTPVTVANNSTGKVHITANEAGDQYNGFSQFYAVKANDPKIIVNLSDNSKPSAGGSNQVVKYITQSDINTAKDNLSKEALDDARTDFNKKVEELKLVDDSKKEEVVSATATPSVNSEADEFNLTVKVSIKALAFNLNDVGSLVKAEVERQLGFTKQIVDDGSKDATIAVDSFDIKDGSVQGSIKTSAYVSSKFDENQIKDELIGMTGTKAENYLQGLDGVDQAKVEFWPPFIKIFPRIKNHIFLSIQVSDLSKDN